MLFSVHSVEEAVLRAMPEVAYQNNQDLFILARAVQALEVQHGTFSKEQRLAVFRQWHR
jgi:hypothetical protein